MADEIKVVITGKDGVSKVFQEVSKSADSMQKAVTKDATAAGTSLNKMSQDAQKASSTTGKALDDMAQHSESASRAFTVAGAAIGASLALFSRDIVTNQQNVATLTRTYGEAAGQLQAFAQQIQSSTTFSSESAIASANAFGTLVRNYGLSVDQVQQLIQVSADLAATSGLSLEDTSMRVQAAIRGEGESAEALGLTMNQQAIDRNNLTLTMSNQEAAQFRLNALLEQSAFAQGAAGDKAETTAGQIAQLNNKFQDLARGALEATGPLPQIVGGLTNIGAESALAITGVVSLAKGIRELAAAQKAASAAGEGGALFGGLQAVGSGGLAAGLGSVALGAAAVTAAFLPLAAALALAAHNADEYKATVTEQTDAIDAWAKAISDPALREGYTYLAQDIRDFDVAVQDSQGNVVDITDALDELLTLNTGDLAKLTEILKANNIEIGNLDITNLEDLQIVYAAIIQVEKEHADYQMQQAEITQSHAQAVSDLTEQYGSLTPAVTEASGQFRDLWLQVHMGEFAARKAAAGLNELSETASRGGESISHMTEVTDGLGETASRTAGEIHHLFTEMDGFKDLQLPEGFFDDGTAETASRGMSTWRGEMDKAQFSQEQLTGTTAEAAQAMADYTKQAADAAKAVGLLSTNAQLFQAAGIKTPALDVAVNLQGGQNAFDPVMGAIKQAQSLASNIGGAKSWADTLIGDPGTWSQLDQLLSDGRINQEQYNDAQAAQVSISRDVTNAQQDLLAVQANLAPVMADATRQQAEYIDGLQDLPAQQQLVALGYMDTAESAKAMQLAQLAAASTGSEMQASTEQMIQAAAAADPVLKAMLEDMGLLNAADGTVNFDTNAADIGTAITALSESIDALIIAIGGVPTIHTDTNAPDTQIGVDNLHGAIDALPSDVNTNINATDNASGVIGGVSAALDGINGKTASTFLNNYVTTFTSNVSSVSPPSGGSGPIGGRNGGVMGYANGGMVTAELAEVGTELARFANGGEALVPRHGLYSIPVGTNILPAPATKAELRRRGSDEGFHIGVLNIYPTTPDIGAEIRSAVLAGSRAR
jgi:hypothetical protein